MDRFEISTPNIIFVAKAKRIDPGLVTNLLNHKFQEEIAKLAFVAYREATPRDTFLFVNSRTCPTALAVKSNGAIAYGFANGLILQRSPQGKDLFSFAAHAQHIVTGLACDSHYFLSSGGDHTVKFWDQRLLSKPVFELPTKEPILRLVPMETSSERYLCHEGYTSNQTVCVTTFPSHGKLQIEYSRRSPAQVETRYRQQLGRWEDELGARSRANTWPMINTTRSTHKERFHPQIQTFLRAYKERFSIPFLQGRAPTAILPIDSNRIVTGFSDGAVELWAPLGRKVQYPTGSNSCVVDLISLGSPHNNVMFAAALFDNTIRVFGLYVDKPIKTIHLNDSPVAFYDNWPKNILLLTSLERILTYDCVWMERTLQATRITPKQIRTARQRRWVNVSNGKQHVKSIKDLALEKENKWKKLTDTTK